MLSFKKVATFLLISISLLSVNVFADERTEQIDTIRANLTCQQDKNSSSYIRSKEKLNKLIKQSNIDYTTEGRFKDVERLIREKKFNAAIYELSDLIDNNTEVSKSYEYLGDIYFETSRSASNAAKYYRKSISADNLNISPKLKIAKLYLKSNKNIIGTEYLKDAVELSPDATYFDEIENIILEKIHPQNRFEANNLYEVLGILYIKSGKNSKGYAAFNKAIALNPNDIGLKYQFANILYSDNQVKNAISLFSSILKEYPNDTQIRISKAKMHIKDGDFENAKQEYLNVLAKYPKSNQARYGIYQIYKDKLGVKDIISEMYKNNPNYSMDSHEINDFIEFLNEIKDYQAAKEFNNYLLKLDSKIEPNTDSIEQKEQQVQKNIEQSPQKLQQKIETKTQPNIKNDKQIQPKQKVKKQNYQNKILQQFENNEALDKKLASEQNKKQQEEKLKQIQMEKERIAKENKEKQKQQQAELERQAKEKLELENLEKQRKLALEKEKEEKRLQEKKLQEAIENKKKADIEAAENEIINIKTKKPKIYEECMQNVNKYLNTKPLTSAIHTAIANTYKQANMPYNAIKYYNEAKKMEPLNSDTYYNIGLTYMELNRLDDSKEYLEKAINLNNDNTKAQNLIAFVNQKIATGIINSAYSDFENKKYIEAYTKLDKGIKKLPQNSQLYYYRALVTDAMGRNAAAIIDFQKAIELDPGYYMAYYYLGKSYEKINDSKSALVAYERFLSTEPPEPDLINEIQKKVIILGKQFY